MKKTLTLIVLIFITNSLIAENVQISELGKFKLEYTTATKTDVMRGSQLIATVAEQVGMAFVLSTPTNIQQIDYILNSGDLIKKGQPFAILRGPEVHHFISEFKVFQKLLELTEKRLNRNKKLFRKKLIDEEKWLTISKNYYETMLEFEHMHHFYDLIISINESDDSIIIKAPLAGVFTIPINQSHFSEGDVIASFVPEKSIKLKLQLPSNLVSNISYIESNLCKLNVTKKNRIASGAFVEVWTESLTDECPLLLGQQIMVYPFFEEHAFLVPKTAVFSINGKDKIFVKAKSELKPIDISLLTSIDKNYLLSSQVDLTNAQILSSSVSAVQGILMGLGEE